MSFASFGYEPERIQTAVKDINRLLERIDLVRKLKEQKETKLAKLEVVRVKQNEKNVALKTAILQTDQEVANGVDCMSDLVKKLDNLKKNQDESDILLSNLLKKMDDQEVEREKVFGKDFEVFKNDDGVLASPEGIPEEKP